MRPFAVMSDMLNDFRLSFPIYFVTNIGTSHIALKTVQQYVSEYWLNPDDKEPQVHFCSSHSICFPKVLFVMHKLHYFVFEIKASLTHS